MTIQQGHAGRREGPVLHLGELVDFGDAKEAELVLEVLKLAPQLCLRLPPELVDLNSRYGKASAMRSMEPATNGNRKEFGEICNSPVGETLSNSFFRFRLPPLLSCRSRLRKMRQRLHIHWEYISLGNRTCVQGYELCPTGLRARLAVCIDCVLTFLQKLQNKAFGLPLGYKWVCVKYIV